MCVACVEYIKGKLSLNEFLRNREEFLTEKHNEEADNKATRAINAIIFGELADDFDEDDFPTSYTKANEDE